jgi:hypothetical protein
MVPAAGLFITNALNATALSGQAHVANRNTISPFVPGRTITIDQVGLSVSTAVASALFKIVIYASDANGRPTTILRQTATLDGGTTGTRFATITPLELTAGTLYWIGVRSSSTATIRSLAAGAAPVLTLTTAATPILQSTLIATETFGSAAADWTYAGTQHSNVLAPLILMRLA